MGHLQVVSKKLCDLDDKLREHIKAAIARRNVLIHEYWQENNIKLVTARRRSDRASELGPLPHYQPLSGRPRQGQG
jgi:hypothetical protein